MKTYLSQLRFALQHIADRKWNYIPALLGVGIGYSGMSISVSLIPQILIDSAAAGGLHSAGRGLAVYAGLFVLSSLLAVLSQYAYRRTALRAAAALRLRIMEKKTRLPMSFLETSHSGELLSRMLYDMNRVEELYRTKLKEFVNPILALITSVIPMLLLNVPLTLLLLFLSLLCLFVNTTFSGRVRRAGLLAARSNDVLTEQSADILSGLLTIRQYQLADALSARYRLANADFTEKSLKRQRITALLEAMNKGFDILCSIVFLSAGSLMVSAGQTTYGTLVALMSLQSSLIWAALQAGRRFPELFESIASVERIDRFLKEPEEEIRIPASSKTCRDASAFLVFQDVSFSYPRPEKEADGQTGQKNILEHFDLKIRRNETLLLSGPSGCGKSTLFRLLLGFYNVSSGAVLIDGKYLDEYSPQELRGMISLIPQKSFLFQGTILENIRCARPEASEEEVKDAAKAACAHDFITALPGGYDHVLTEQGRSLSFGQRQRIAIARAFLKDAPIILFDEASSGLDNESERAVLESVHTLIRNKTAIIIAHRNADAWNADRKYFFTISH